MDERNNDFDFDFMPIGQAIKKAREARGMTREQLSEIIGYAPRHIQAIENEGKYPSIELFIQLIQMFDVSVDEYIFPDKEVKKSSVRRRLDAQLDKLDDKELSVIEATVNGLCKAKGQRSNLWFFFCPFLISGDTVTIDNAAADSVAVLPTGIARVTFNSIDCSVFHTLYNTYMVCKTVAFPVKEDNVSRFWRKAAVLPLSSLHKPFRALYAACKLWDNAVFNITALVSAPRNETGTPLDTGVEAVPRPVGLTAYIADLRQSHGHDFAVAYGYTVKHLRP